MLRKGDNIPIEIVASEPTLLVKKQSDLDIGGADGRGKSRHVSAGDVNGSDGSGLPTETEMREALTDSRIRVQILPYGDGLKAELYSKPFGDRPPYCKPGRGGATLIANDKDVQLFVKRDLATEAANEQTLMDEIQSLENLKIENRLMTFEKPRDALSLLEALQKHLDICVVEWAEGERYKLRGRLNFSQLSLNIKSGINWFDIHGELRVDEETVLSLQDLLRLSARTGDEFIELDTGGFIALNARLKRQIDALRLVASENRKSLRINRFAALSLDELFDELPALKADKQWREFRQSLTTAQNEQFALPATLNAELRESKHRALVFSQFVQHLAIVRRALDKQKIKYQYLDGSTPQPERERSVHAFQSGEGDLFLISLKAGGLGLNLTAADYVIHLDPWWNPAVEDQASDRAHRIGQQRPVTIYRLVAANTIEEKILELHTRKRDLAQQLLSGADQAARLTVKEMLALLREAP